MKKHDKHSPWLLLIAFACMAWCHTFPPIVSSEIITTTTYTLIMSEPADQSTTGINGGTKQGSSSTTNSNISIENDRQSRRRLAAITSEDGQQQKNNQQRRRVQDDEDLIHVSAVHQQNPGPQSSGITSGLSSSIAAAPFSAEAPTAPPSISAEPSMSHPPTSSPTKSKKVKKEKVDKEGLKIASNLISSSPNASSAPSEAPSLSSSPSASVSPSTSPSLSNQPTTTRTPTMPPTKMKKVKGSKALKVKEGKGKGKKIPEGSTVIESFTEEGVSMCVLQLPENRRRFLTADQKRRSGTSLSTEQNQHSLARGPKPSPILSVTKSSTVRRVLNGTEDDVIRVAETPEKLGQINIQTTASDFSSSPSRSPSSMPSVSFSPNNSLPEIKADHKVEPHMLGIKATKSPSPKKSQKEPKGDKQDKSSDSGDIDPSFIVAPCPEGFVPSSLSSTCNYAYAPDGKSDDDNEFVSNHPYKLSVSDDISDEELNQAIADLEAIIDQVIVSDINDGCSTTTRRHRELEQIIQHYQQHRRRLGTVFTSISQEPTDSLSQDSCSVTNPSPNTVCKKVDSASTVAYNSHTDFANESEITLRLQKVVKEGCEDGSFIQSLNNDKVDKCEFIATSTIVTTGLAGRDGVGNLSANDTVSISPAVTGVGIAMIALLVGGVVLVALLAVKRHKEIRTREFVEMEEGEVTADDLVNKYGLDLNEEDATSMTSQQERLTREIEGDEDGDDEGGNRYDGGGQYNPHGTNVHKCTSSLCDVCAATKGNDLAPKFVGTYDMYTAHQNNDEWAVDDVVEF